MSDDARAISEKNTKDYYAGAGVDTFYTEIWGGEDIHIGLYEAGDDVRTASRRTVDRIAETLGPGLDDGAAVIDFGSGYGGSARRIADRYGAHVCCLNICDIQNARNLEVTKAAGLDDRVNVVLGSYLDVPAEDASFDVVWSQDALLHAPDPAQALKEAFRVLKPGGRLAFTDPMQKGEGHNPELQPVYDRVNLDAMFAPETYRRTAGAIGFEEQGFEDWTPHMATHYAAVDDAMAARRDDLLARDVPEEFITRMSRGLRHWVDAAKANRLVWGLFVFKKPNVA